jgi:hypothetical protein
MNAHHVTLRQIVVEIRIELGVRRGGDRRELKKRGRGMKDRLDKSMGIVTLIVEDLAKNQSYRSLKIHQACSSLKAKLIRFLR